MIVRKSPLLALLFLPACALAVSALVWGNLAGRDHAHNWPSQTVRYDLSGGETLGSLIESEIARWGKAVRDNRIDAGR
jgi:hypothetical protein